jgi:hypothetical protein
VIVAWGVAAREREANDACACALEPELDLEVEVGGGGSRAGKMAGVDERRDCCASILNNGCEADVYGARGELLVSRGGEMSEHHSRGAAGGGIRFALREVRRGEGVCGAKYLCSCWFVTGPAGVDNRLDMIPTSIGRVCRRVSLVTENW